MWVGVLLLGTILGISITSRFSSVPYERDEISWYFHTEFFDEAFVHRRLASPLWDGYESFDHPPISKYVYGAFLYANNNTYIATRDVLERTYGRWAFYKNIARDEDISETRFAPIIRLLRSLNTIIAIAIIFEIFLLGYLVTGSVWFSLLLCTALGFNSLFYNMLPVVTSDNHALFFSLFSIICYMYSLRSKNLWWIAGSAIASALAVGTKLTGVFIFFGIVTTEIIRWVGFARSTAFIPRRIALFVVISLGVWWLSNPALYRSPVTGTWAYFSFRNFQSANIAYHVPEVALHSITDRANAIICTLVLRSCRSHGVDGSMTSVNGINSLLLVLSILGVFQAAKKKRADIVLLVMIGYFTVFGFLAFLSNYGIRYFVPLQVIFFLLQIFGIQITIQAVIDYVRKLRLTK